ncbi:hypothetical protein M413DRAFT_30328 [Hebeloma cylindrosporum]|uniref:Uncharacterized protein n=1 Tax=Hebeloma cylindrosporum TaxID=76867 RepID=A0A0C3BNH1_HEBCY|nr:hypothetical protein M413DRAFT_30328 [Hebeloma cylindrosporum h7]
MIPKVLAEDSDAVGVSQTALWDLSVVSVECQNFCHSDTRSSSLPILPRLHCCDISTFNLWHPSDPHASPKIMESSSNLVDERYERSFSDPPEELLNQLSDLQPHPRDASQPNATQAMGAPTIPVDAPSDGGPIVPSNNPSPTKSRFRRPPSAPPAELTPTRLRPRKTPSKLHPSEVTDRANARRAQAPKSPSPSPPVPSQLLAMSLASSTPHAPNPSATDGTTNDDPFKISQAPPPLIIPGPYPFSNQFALPQQMVSPYASSFPHFHGFPPMNAAQYRLGHYDPQLAYGDLAKYGGPPGVSHGPIPLSGPGHPPGQFQQPSAFPHFSDRHDSHLTSTSREPTVAPRDTTPSLPAQAGCHYLAPNPSLPMRPLNASFGQNDSASNDLDMPLHFAPAKIMQPQYPPATIDPPESGVLPTLGVGPGLATSKPTPQATGIALAEVTPNPTTDHMVVPGTPLLSDVDFTDLRIPPGPSDIPTLKVLPATPNPTTPKRPSIPRLNCNPPSNPTEDDSVPTDYHQLLDHDSPTVGRLSKAHEKALISGLEALDKLVKEISISSGLSRAQIVERWNGGTPRSLNSWNIYQAYIRGRLHQEIGRLISVKESEEAPPEEIAALQKTLDEGGNFSSKIISDAYEVFQAAFPGKADKMLHRWAQINILEIEKSVGQRSGNFRKQRDQFQALAKQCADRYGFEFSGILVGGVVNQDNALAAIIATEAAADFFPVRLKRADDLVLGHMKVHVYDYYSKKSEMDTSPDGLQQSLCDDLSPMESALPSTSTKRVSAKRAKSTTKAETSSRSSSENHAVIDQLKEHVIALGASAGLRFSPNQLPWKSMIRSFAEKGYVIWNYPEEADFPCDDTRGKGIHGISVKEHALLLDAFKHPTHPIKAVLTYESGGVPLKQPAIMGVPPPANSKYTHGRRKFLGEKKTDPNEEDRLGLPRLDAHGSGAKRKTPSSKSEEPPSKKVSKGKKKAIESSDKASTTDNDDDMFLSDDPKPKVKSAHDTTTVPLFSTSPRATRSMRHGGKQSQKAMADRVSRKNKKIITDDSDGDDDVPLSAILRGATSDVSDHDPQSSTKTKAIKQVKPTKMSSEGTDPSSDNSKSRIDETVQDSPGTLAKRSNVANLLFPPEPKNLHPVPSSPMQSIPLLPSDTSAQSVHLNASTTQPPPHQIYGHYLAPPSNYPEGPAGAPPSILPTKSHTASATSSDPRRDYPAPSSNYPEGPAGAPPSIPPTKSAPLPPSGPPAQLPNSSTPQLPAHQSYRHYPAPPTNHPEGPPGALPSFPSYYTALGYGHPYAPPLPQMNVDNQHANSSTLPSGGQQGFGGNYPAWAYNHLAINPYGPYHHAPYGYSSSTQQGQPPPVHPPLPTGGTGSGVPATNDVRHPSTNSVLESLGMEVKDNPTGV